MTFYSNSEEDLLKNLNKINIFVSKQEAFQVLVVEYLLINEERPCNSDLAC